MKDPIERQDAIEAVIKRDANCGIDSAEVLKTLPSAQPEPCEDAVSREAVSSWLKQYGQDVLHGKYKFSLMYIWKNLMDLPSAQPEIIRCKDCIHAIEDALCGGCWCKGKAVTSYHYCGYAERRTDE